MSDAGRSAEVWAEEARRGAQRGLWRRVLAWLGFRVLDRRTARVVAAREAGAVGERQTAVLLRSLELEGWAVLHDRRLPGARTANADHILISPGGRVFVPDSKLWSARWRVHGAGGELWHGAHSRQQAVRSLRFEADLVARALGVEVTALMAVHQAPVEGGGFVVDGIGVLPAEVLVASLRALDGRPDPVTAAALAARAERVFPQYVDGG